jgi:hypothetical protein
MKKLIVVIESKLHEKLFQALACVGFWNQEGEKVYGENRAGRMGNAFTQKEARRLSNEDFVMNSLIHDLKTLEEGNGELWPEGFAAGKSGSHIWIHNEKNERVILIHF